MKNKKYLMIGIGVSLVLVGGLIFFFANDKLIKLENKDAENIEQEVIVENIDDSEEKDSEIEENLDLETEEDLEKTEEDLEKTEGDLGKPEADADVKDNEATNTNVAQNQNQQQNQQEADEDPFKKINQLIEESKVEIEEDTGEPAEKIYQRISSKYVSKLENTSKKLIKELIDEEKNNTNGRSGLSEITNEKINELIKINDEGIEELNKTLADKGVHGKYIEHDKHLKKILNTFEAENNKILEEFEKLANNY